MSKAAFSMLLSISFAIQYNRCRDASAACKAFDAKLRAATINSTSRSLTSKICSNDSEADDIIEISLEGGNNSISGSILIPYSLSIEAFVELSTLVTSSRVVYVKSRSFSSAMR